MTPLGWLGRKISTYTKLIFLVQLWFLLIFVTKQKKCPVAVHWNISQIFIFSGTKALEDAGISYDEVEQACVGYVYGKQRSCYWWVHVMHVTYIPIYIVYFFLICHLHVAWDILPDKVVFCSVLLLMSTHSICFYWEIRKYLWVRQNLLYIPAKKNVFFFLFCFFCFLWPCSL